MAVNADSVIVEVETKLDQASNAAAAAGFDQTMNTIKSSAGQAEQVVVESSRKMNLASNQQRIALLELQHVVRGTSEQLAAGAPATQILAQHMAMLGEAVTLAGGSFGRVGAILSGPWGIALTLAVGAAAILINRHHEQAETLQTVYDKLVKHKEQTALSEQADRLWSTTLDGLAESLGKTNAELGKQLELQPVAQRQAVNNANATLLELGRQLDAAEQSNAPEAKVRKLEQLFAQAAKEVYQQTILFGQAQGEAISDMNKRVDDWIGLQQNHLRYLVGVHPELEGQFSQISGVIDNLKNALNTGLSAGLTFDPAHSKVVQQVEALNAKLAESPQFINQYIQGLARLSAQIVDTANNAKNAPEAIRKFEQAIIGAEGTGPNRMGSSAAGFGQFMPGTFEHYFRQAYPNQADLPKAAIDDFRNNKEVAQGVIDTATKDYVAILQRAGQQITAAALYTMHMLSAGDPRGRVALGLLTAPDDASARSIVGSRVVAQNGNIFTGTAAQARSAIAQRIGDSSSATSSGAVALAHDLDSIMGDIDKKYAEGVDKQQEINLLKGGERADVEAIVAGHVNLNELLERGILPSLKAWDIEYKQIEDTQKEVLDLGNQLVDDVFNPDTWTSWGNAGKVVLHDIEMEFIRLAAINPLKNLLAGPNAPQLPTLNSLFSLFSGGGSNLFSDPTSLLSTSGGLTHFASGGRTKGGMPIQVGESGKEVFIPDSDGTVVPNNSRASGGFGGPATVLVHVVANDYFDARVVEVSGPVIAQASVAAARGGSAIARQTATKEAIHTLER